MNGAVKYRCQQNIFSYKIIIFIKIYCILLSWTMDPLFLAYSFFRRRKFEECIALCSQLLEKNPYDQVHTVYY